VPSTTYKRLRGKQKERDDASESKVIGCRFSSSEYEEIDDYLQRAGVKRADFVRSAVLAKVRGATTFAELLPSLASSLERQMADLAANVNSQVSGIQALAAAAVASSAMLLDDGKSPPAQVAQAIEEHIGRAVAFAPGVVGNLSKAAGQPKDSPAKSR
jgi:hypothetical protein